MRRCRNTQQEVIWDATTGSSFLPSDKSCPLQKINFLSSMENVYCNVERGKNISLLNFDLSDKRKWSPLLMDDNSEMAVPFSVQDECILYSTPDHQYARGLQQDVAESLEYAIRNSRRIATTFRGDVATIICRSLKQLELAKLRGHHNPEISLPESISNTRNIFGYTLNEPFVSIQDVLARVETTEIHRNTLNPRVEFVVAVKAFAYPGIVSLWVFVGTLAPKS